MVIVAGIGSAGWRRALESLARARFGGEVILVATPAALPSETAPEPAVRRLPAPAGASPQQQRALGFAAARAGRIASVSEDYAIDAAWLEAAAAVSADVTAGPVVVDDDAGYASRCAWMWEYAHLPDSTLRGPVEGPACAWIPAGNVVYRRRALESGAGLAATSEIEAHQAMAAAGLRFEREPALRARYHPPSFGAFVADRRRWSRLGALHRPSLWRALALPPVLLLRQCRHWAFRSGWRMRFALALPAFAVVAFAQMLGELDAVFGANPKEAR